MQNITRKASHILGVGKSGTGKTSYAERYIIGSHHDRVFIYDHQGEFQQRLHLFPCYDIDEMLLRAGKERILCFDYSAAYPGQLEECFELFCAEIFEFHKNYMVPQKREGLLVCDEIQKCTSPNNMPQPWKDIVQTGRRFNLDSFALSQQPNEIHNSHRNQITEFICYRLQEERALKWVSEAGVDVERVKKLPDLHYLWQNMQTGEAREGRIDYPKK
jgi:hypothetical protein